jgi:hypothetical protein
MSADPIILIGTQRSGTTWLGQLFAQCEEVAYWSEPRHVWSWGNWFRPNDSLGAGDATPTVARHIRGVFADYVRRRGAERLCEKTPGNCWRIPFIHKVFPEAKIVLLVRDGRSVIRSTAEMQRKGVRWIRIVQRLIDTPPWYWPTYAERLPWVLDKVRGRPVKLWGVRPPGWQDWVLSDPPMVVLAKQWASSIEQAVADGRALPEDRYLEVRYEAVLANPKDEVSRIADFVRLASAGLLANRVAETRDVRCEVKWRDELSPEVLDTVQPYMEPTLKRLGYVW